MAEKLRLRAICTRSDTSAPIVRLYAELGLVDAERDSNGNWLFGEAAPEQVKRVKAERIARRGGRKAG
jgi:hypothetical protein